VQLAKLQHSLQMKRDR
jgi:hypothetical protein